MLKIILVLFLSSASYLCFADSNVYCDVKNKPSNIKLNLDISKKDEGWSGSDSIAILALLASIATIFINQRQIDKSRKNSIYDEFWMREILFPQFLDKFSDFIKKAPELYACVDTLNEFYGDYALGELNSLEDSLILVSAGNQNLGIALKNIIDSFHDDVMEVSDLTDLQMLLGKIAKDVVKEMQRAQYKID